jgi:hypothetical protein
MSTATAPPQPDTQAESPGPSGPVSRFPKPLLIGGAIVLFVLAAVVSFGIVRGTGDDAEKTAAKSSVAGPNGTTYRIPVAQGWQSLKGEALAEQPGDPLTVLRRQDGKGFLVIRAEGRAPASFAAFTKELDREFKKRIPDFQRRSTRTLRIKAGPAYFYSYIRKEQGTVHSVVLVPAGQRSYVLNTIAPGGEDEIAKQLGRMIVNFDA